ncbi:MAG: M1 family metallopeptidase [Bacteroidetes bacterium]|nr:M1 family metallopeptidase [Bacteroidota bacterium]
MKKYKVVIPVFIIVLFFASFWGYVGFKIISILNSRDEMYKYYQIISSKYYNNFQKEDLRHLDSEFSDYQDLYDVKEYSLKVSFGIPEKKIFGDMTMRSLNLSDTLNSIYIDLASNLKLNSVKLNGTDARYKRTFDYIIVFSGGEINKNDNFEIKINYEGIPENKGFDSFNIKKFDEEPAIYTLSEPNYAKTWWPCKDVLTDKAETDVYITVPPQLTAVSNGLLEEVINENDGQKTFHWKSSYPISTYLVSLAIGKYDKWTDTYSSADGKIQMPVEYYTFPSFTDKAKIDWQNTVSMIKFFSGKFGEYPFINEKYGMALFGWVGGAMEHQTISSMGYTLITGNGRYEDVVVHELVHQWFGDAVTPDSWKDIWLNEGFASYGEALWVEHTKGADAYRDFMKKSDYGFFMGTVYNPEGYIFGPTVYKKGSWILHMLRKVVGDGNFFQILREYYETYKYKNASTQDFINICRDVSGKDLSYFFDQWIFNGTGRPEYSLSWKYEVEDISADRYNVNMILKQTQEDRDIYSMPLEIMIVTDKGNEVINVYNDSRIQEFDHTVTGKPLEVIIDKDNWVLKRIAKEDKN